MDTNPYAASPKAELGLAQEPVTRSRWVACLLALFIPPVAMLYLGRPWRALAYLFATHGVSFAIIFLSLGGLIGFATTAVWLPLLVLPIALMDAWNLAPRVRWLQQPGYSRVGVVVVVGVLAFLWPMGMRLFVVEPYRVPSVSMEPTLRRGDQILVDKRAYGWSVPFGGARLVRFAGPARGDVAAMLSPRDPTVVYVKRILGVPGDRIAFDGRTLSVNGKELPLSLVAAGPQSLGFPPGDDRQLYTEGEGAESHLIFYQSSATHGATRLVGNNDFCANDGTTLICNIPEGKYFVLGDNRDNSEDSRHFGYVAEDRFVGRVTRIWASDADGSRAGKVVR